MANMQNGKNNFHQEAINAAIRYVDGMKIFYKFRNIKFSKAEQDIMKYNACMLYDQTAKKMEKDK